MTRRDSGTNGDVLVTVTLPGFAPVQTAEGALADAVQGVMRRLALPGTARASVQLADAPGESMLSLVVGRLAKGQFSAVSRSSFHAEEAAFAMIDVGPDPGSSAGRLSTAVAAGDSAVATFLRWWVALTLAEAPEDLLAPVAGDVTRAVWAECVEVLGFAGLSPDAPPSGFGDLLSAIVHGGGSLEERGLIGRLANAAGESTGSVTASELPATALAEQVLAAATRTLIIAAQKDTLAELVIAWYGSGWLTDHASGLADWEQTAVGAAVATLAVPAALAADSEVPTGCFVLRAGALDVDVVRISPTFDHLQTVTALLQSVERVGRVYGGRLLESAAVATALDGMNDLGAFSHTAWFARLAQGSETINAAVRTMLDRRQSLNELPVLLRELAAVEGPSGASAG